MVDQHIRGQCPAAYRGAIIGGRRVAGGVIVDIDGFRARAAQADGRAAAEVHRAGAAAGIIGHQNDAGAVGIGDRGIDIHITVSAQGQRIAVRPGTNGIINVNVAVGTRRALA